MNELMKNNFTLFTVHMLKSNHALLECMIKKHGKCAFPKIFDLINGQMFFLMLKFKQVGECSDEKSNNILNLSRVNRNLCS